MVDINQKIAAILSPLAPVELADSEADLRLPSIYITPLTNASIKSDGTADEEVDGAVEAVQEAQKRLGDLLDFIFDGNAAEAFFSGMRPFSPIGGRFYYEIALESLGNFITARYKDEGKKLNKRVLDYTKKYGKGTGKA